MGLAPDSYWKEDGTFSIEIISTSINPSSIPHLHISRGSRGMVLRVHGSVADALHSISITPNNEPPIAFAKRDVVSVTDADGKILWQNWNHRTDQKTCDPEEASFHGGEQHRLLEYIFSSLNRKVDDEAELLPVFGNVATHLIAELSENPEDPRVRNPQERLSEEVVVKPIEMFTGGEAEFKYLLGEVLKRVVESFCFRVSHPYRVLQTGFVAKDS